MVKAILTLKPDSSYNDKREEWYHFPQTYLNQIRNSLGDWFIYYEPRRLSTHLNKAGGKQAYFAVGKIADIKSDLHNEGHYYAKIEKYLDFDHMVSFKEGDFYYEGGLVKEDGSTNKGAFGRAVRNIEDHEYEAILRAGFEFSLIGEEKYYRRNAEPVQEFGEGEQQEFERPIVEKLVARPFRDDAFRFSVRHAYNETCAMTGLKIINGGGRPEVQAAHIMPVADKGPDSIRNGLALSGTVHWMFDRGLLSLDDEYRILTADEYLPPQVKHLLNSSGRITLPERSEFFPHPRYLEFHRKTFFKG
ncbi:restriction endonuclease [Emcibacter nanhaiensis]|uniref:Restriction endonuclease n=2 Tax=Emcibacter nanhaiensis TaxID=1505037 RepID=A0A501PNJ3_9PROT|nr:restriction endonuclease [Emcibacter nanhaiensis]